MRHVLLILLLLHIPLASLFSQSISGSKALDIPQKFVLPSGDHIIEKEDGFLIGNIWEVISDRMYNKTTIKAGGGASSKVLQYLDKFYVIELKKKHLHLVKDPNLSSDGIFSEFAEDYGWIPAENLLLWKHCLVNDDGHNKRAFIFKDKNNDLYFNDYYSIQNNESNFFQVLYVLKEEKDRSLLSKSIRILGEVDDINETLLGWVSNERFDVFSSNIFLEPNMSNNFQSEITNGDISYPIFTDKRSIQKKRSGKKIDPSKIIWDPIQQLPPSFFRFPLVDIDESIGEVLIYIPYEDEQIGNFNTEPENIGKFIRGYCSIDKSNKELEYNKTLLFTKTDIINLIAVYELLLNANTYDTSVFNGLIKEAFQVNMSGVNLEHSTIESLLINKFGCCDSNKYNTETISNMFFSKESSSEYMELIESNLRKIESIFNEQASSLSFMSNGTEYYWIPCYYIQ